MPLSQMNIEYQSPAPLIPEHTSLKLKWNPVDYKQAATTHYNSSSRPAQVHDVSSGRGGINTVDLPRYGYTAADKSSDWTSACLTVVNKRAVSA